MALILRYIPQILIVIALAVIVTVVVRRLPKTAKLEADLARENAAAATGASGKEIKKRTKKASGAAMLAAKKVGGVSVKAGKAVGAQISKAYKKVAKGRLGQVFKNAARKRLPGKSSGAEVSGIKSVSESPADEKRDTVVKLLKEAEDYARQANWSAAEKIYIKVVTLAPKTLEAYLGLGNLYLKQKNWDDAAESFRVVLAGDEENIAAWGNLGQALANKGEWVAAAEAYERAVKLDPGNATRHATLALAYVTTKDFKKAVRAYREAVKHDRENLSHKIELAKVAKLVGDKPLAEDMLTQVLTRDPLNEQAKTLLKEVRENSELE